MTRFRASISKRLLFWALDITPAGPVRESLRTAIHDHAIRSALIAQCLEGQGE